MQVVLGYKSHPKTYMVHTPSRKQSVRRILRRSYPLLFSGMAKTSSLHRKLMIKAIAREVRKEMRLISSNCHNTVFCDKKKELKNFSWSRMWDELMEHAPLLMSVISGLVVRPEESKPMLCLVASMFLKKRNKSLALTQRCISVFLYGNACSKQVRLQC